MERAEPKEQIDLFDFSGQFLKAFATRDWPKLADVTDRYINQVKFFGTLIVKEQHRPDKHKTIPAVSDFGGTEGGDKSVSFPFCA